MIKEKLHMPDKTKSVAARVRGLDFTNVKEGGGNFNKRRQPAGDYRAKVLKVVEVEKKKDPGHFQWLFTIEVNGAKYPYYCGFGADELWKIRNLWVAVGIPVPKKKVKVDPARVIGKDIAVTLEDDEYDGKMQSVVNAVFPLAELDSDDDDDTDDEEEEEDDAEEESSDDEEEDEEEEPAPKPKTKAKSKTKAKPAPAEDDDEDEDDDLDELDIEDV